MSGLTGLQAKLLAYICDYQCEAGGVSPSFDEMQHHLDLSSRSQVHRLLAALQERGFITRIPARARCITVMKRPGDSVVQETPMPARAQRVGRNLFTVTNTRSVGAIISIFTPEPKKGA